MNMDDLISKDSIKLNVKTLSFNQIRNKVLKYNKKQYHPYFHLLEKFKMKFNWLNIK